MTDHHPTCDMMQPIRYGRDPSGHLTFDWSVMMRIKCTCGLDERLALAFWRDAGRGVRQWVVPR